MRIVLLMFLLFVSIAAQTPPIEPGVSLELAKWRAERYSDVRYKLDLTLEKMSPMLKGTIEIRVKVGARTPSSASSVTENLPIILDWRKIKGSEERSTISNIFVNGKVASVASSGSHADEGVRAPFEEINEHLIFREGVVIGENVIKLDFTSPILTSGSAITRYIDKEDGSEYIYSLFVPSDASTAFPVFDQPDLKARFTLNMIAPNDWVVVTNDFRLSSLRDGNSPPLIDGYRRTAFFETKHPISTYVFAFAAGPFERFTDSERCIDLFEKGATAEVLSNQCRATSSVHVRKSQAAKFKPHTAEVFRLNREAIKYFETYFDYKFPFPKYDLVLIPEFPFGGMEHAGATFLREASIIFPQEPTKNDYISRGTLIFHEAAHQWFGDTVTMRWFDDLWLKEGFATFTAYKAMEKIMPEYNAWKVFYERVKQAAYQTDSTKGTTPIYQEIKNLSAAKSAYGAIVYNKAPAFLRQAEFYLGEEKFQTAVRAFLKKHEFGNAGWEDLVTEFQATTWGESREADSLSNPVELQRTLLGQLDRRDIKEWATLWVNRPGLPILKATEGKRSVDVITGESYTETTCCDLVQQNSTHEAWPFRTQVLVRTAGQERIFSIIEYPGKSAIRVPLETTSMVPREKSNSRNKQEFFFGNCGDYGYGIFLLDPKSRDYVLKNIGKEKDDFLRTMMWGALWDSVREAEMGPREYVDLVVKELKTETDESTIQTLLSRVSTAMRYYIDGGGSSAGSVPPAVAGGALKPGQKSIARSAKTPPATAGGTDRASDIQTRVEALLIDRMQNAPTSGQKITYYRAFLNLASSENARRIMKEILKGGNPNGSEGVKAGADPTPLKSQQAATSNTLPTGRVSASTPKGGNPNGSEGVKRGANASLKQNQKAAKSNTLPTGRVSALTTKDRFDIVQRLIILGDPEGENLLAELERIETGDDAKRYAYAVRAGFATAENKAKFWNDFVNNKDISESWIEAGFGPFNNIRHSDLTLPYLERALKELPNHKRNRKIFFVNGWLGAFIGGQRSDEALAIINKFLAENPDLDRDLRLKILENADIIERAVKIRAKFRR